MSGYLQRLIARSAGGGSKIRPLLGPQQDVVLETGAGNAEFLADVQQQLLSPLQDNKSTRSVVEQSVPSPGDMSVIVAETLPQPTVFGATKSADTSSIDASKPRIPVAPHVVVPSRKSDHAAANFQLIAAEASDAKQEFNPQANVSADEFRLMSTPPQSRGAATSSSPIAAPRSMDASTATRAQIENRSSPRQQNRQQSEPTEVHVSIGRIEVTALQAPTPTQRAPASARKPMALDEYLAKRGRS